MYQYLNPTLSAAILPPTASQTRVPENPVHPIRKRRRGRPPSRQGEHPITPKPRKFQDPHTARLCQYLNVCRVLPYLAYTKTEIRHYF